MGREEAGPATHSDPTPAALPKKVVVVGAGPGWLQAARVLSQRLHNVQVFRLARAPAARSSSLPP